jgi:cell division protein FtsW
MAFLDPWEDPLDLGFQTIQGLIAFANGGVSGVGIGRGMQKLNYLPATHTDYILSSVAEEYGFMGTGTVMLLYIGLLIFLQHLFSRCRTVLEKTLFWGISLSLLLPIVINFGGVLNLLPFTGMPCPFLSYGGSSMMTSWIKVGLLLNISHRMSREEAHPRGAMVL